MKFNKLFAASLALALSASDVSAKYQNQLRGIASSVLLEDSSWSADSNSGGDSNSQDGFGHRTSTRNWESKDSSADSNSRGDSNSQDGFGFGHRTSTRNWEPADSKFNEEETAPFIDDDLYPLVIHPVVYASKNHATAPKSTPKMSIVL